MSKDAAASALEDLRLLRDLRNRLGDWVNGGGEGELIPSLGYGYQVVAALARTIDRMESQS